MPKDLGQKCLFDNIDDYDLQRREWQNMPEYENVEEKQPEITAIIKFKTEQDYQVFKEIIKEHLFNGVKPFDGMQLKNLKTTWFPHKEKASKYIYTDESEISDIHNK